MSTSCGTVSSSDILQRNRTRVRNSSSNAKQWLLRAERDGYPVKEDKEEKKDEERRRPVTVYRRTREGRGTRHRRERKRDGTSETERDETLP